MGSYLPINNSQPSCPISLANRITSYNVCYTKLLRECGHTILVPQGRMCGCGIEGHLEAYCSAPGMKRTAFEILVKNNDTKSPLASKSFNELNSKLIYEAAANGDKTALEVFEVTGAFLGQGLADSVHHLSPEAVFLFGGPTAAGDLLFKPTKASMEKHLLPTVITSYSIHYTKLHDIFESREELFFHTCLGWLKQ